MSLRDALEQLKSPAEPGQCKFATWIDSLPDDDQEAVAEMLAMEVSDPKIHEAIKPFVNISREAIRRHRREQCICFSNMVL